MESILNNTARAETMEDWDMVAGEWNFDGIVYQDYIISESGYEFLLVFYKGGMYYGNVCIN